jgi:nitrogen fixation protein
MALMLFSCDHIITVIKLYIMKKGNILVFKDREETIVKVNNNRITGEVVTNSNTYSTDFIKRWLDFGFIRIK